MNFENKNSVLKEINFLTEKWKKSSFKLAKVGY